MLPNPGSDQLAAEDVKPVISTYSMDLNTSKNEDVKVDIFTHFMDLHSSDSEDVKPDITTSIIDGDTSGSQDTSDWEDAQNKRFATPVAPQDIKALQNDYDGKSKNTKKNTKWGKSIWEEWRIEKQKSTGRYFLRNV